MTEKTTYICDYCGKVFDDGDECYLHEWEHKFESIKNHVKLIRGRDGILIELPLALESVDQCTVIYCDGTDEAWDIIKDAFDWEGYSYPAKYIQADGHIFVYDDEVDNWFCLEKKMNYFVGLSNKIGKVIRGN